MLTPGIEYFSVQSDEEAIAFGRGTQPNAVSTLRADGIAPDGLLAILGSLLSGESFRDVIEPSRLVRLWTEEREDGTILVVRVPDSVTGALRAADAEALARVARRALSYADFAGAEEAVVTEFLSRLAAAATHDRLYARMIVAGDSPSPALGNRSLLGLMVLAVAGVAGAVALAVLLSRVRPEVVGLASGLGVATVLPLIFAIRARAVQRITDLDLGAAVVRIAAAPSFLNGLAGTLHRVVAVDSLSPVPRSKDLYLSVDPAGLTLRFGAAAVAHIPRATVTSLGLASARIRFGALAQATLPVLEFGLRSRDGAIVTWSVPVLTTGKTKPDPRASEQIFDLVRQRLGLPD